MPAPSRPNLNASSDAERQADAPIADRRIDHRHLRVLQAAQHAAGHRLRAVDDLEQAGEGEEGDGEARRPLHCRGPPTSMKPLISVRGHSTMISAISAMKETPSTKAVQPARVMPTGSPAPIGAADPHGAGLADAHRHHEADRGDLDGDGVRGERRGADQSHQQCRGVEDRHLEGEDAGDRQAEPHQAAKARPVGAPEAAEQMVTPKPSFEGNDNDQPAEHQEARQRGGEARAGNAHPRESRDCRRSGTNWQAR